MDDKLRNIEVEQKFISVQKKVTMDDTQSKYTKKTNTKNMMKSAKEKEREKKLP